MRTQIAHRVFPCQPHAHRKARSLPLIVACIAAFLTANDSRAANVTLTRQVRLTTAAEIASDPALVGRAVTDYFMTIDTDIVSIDQVSLQLFGGGLYQHPSGSDAEPPAAMDVATTPALGADAWITTPGATMISGGGFGNFNALWFDAQNNGPQIDFHFARLTVPNTAFSPYERFNFRVNVIGSDGLTLESHHRTAAIGFHVPEPAAGFLAVCALVGLAAL